MNDYEKRGDGNRLLRTKLAILYAYYLLPVISYIFIFCVFYSRLWKYNHENFYFKVAFPVLMIAILLYKLVSAKYKFVTDFSIRNEAIHLVYLTPFLKRNIVDIELEKILDIETAKPNFFATISGELNIKTKDKNWISFNLSGKNLRREIATTITSAHLGLPKPATVNEN